MDTSHNRRAGAAAGGGVPERLQTARQSTAGPAMGLDLLERLQLARQTAATVPVAPAAAGEDTVLSFNRSRPTCDYSGSSLDACI